MDDPALSVATRSTLRNDTAPVPKALPAPLSLGELLDQEADRLGQDEGSPLDVHMSFHGNLHLYRPLSLENPTGQAWPGPPLNEPEIIAADDIRAECIKALELHVEKLESRILALPYELRAMIYANLTRASSTVDVALNTRCRGEVDGVKRILHCLRFKCKTARRRYNGTIQLSLEEAVCGALGREMGPSYLVWLMAERFIIASPSTLTQLLDFSREPFKRLYPSHPLANPAAHLSRVLVKVGITFPTEVLLENDARAVGTVLAAICSARQQAKQTAPQLAISITLVEAGGIYKVRFDDRLSTECVRFLCSVQASCSTSLSGVPVTVDGIRPGSSLASRIPNGCRDFKLPDLTELCTHLDMAKDSAALSHPLFLSLVETCKTAGSLPQPTSRIFLRITDMMWVPYCRPLPCCDDPWGMK